LEDDSITMLYSSETTTMIVVSVGERIMIC